MMCYLESSGEDGFQWSRTEDRTSLVAQTIKNLPAMQEMQVQSQVGKIPWRRKWQPIAVFLPGKFYGQRNLVGYSPLGCKKLDIT